MSERILLGIAGLLAALVLGLALFWHPELPDRQLPKAATVAGGDFTLESASGPVSLQDFRGKLVLLYFGYTYCPDICPTSLSATSEGLRQLAPDELARVAMLFVSVDPERDTPGRLKEYAEFFHPQIIGATGTSQNLAEIAKRYGVFYARQKVETAGGGYVVDHTSDTYVVGTDGALLGKIAHATPPDQVVVAIRKYLNQKP
ncbi:redoxin domain-containing protein [Dechloromonas sp. TW-R-39-2]|uniref:SCO family protein n=1 Tax=Dechloromonas sp. TW-R-39-2 TaxID=2654218 RepID=UPI00193E8101|nr:SCO family protein [Dechloromonas sp. TW-R-39-2]QRM20060.1 redoxin domain-containing protein [Dechloromonas sp. TW-R-39-2]